MVGAIGPTRVLSPGRAESLAERAVREVVPPLAPEEERTQPANHTASTVALAPASMAALIEAQERMASDTPLPARAHTARKILGLISRLADGEPPPPAEASFTVRRLETARERLNLR